MVGKSESRVPMAMTRSASRATALPALPPVEPSAPTWKGWSQGSAPLPACVSVTGMPKRRAKASSAALASL